MKTLTFAVLILLTISATAQKDNGLNQNITIAFGAGASHFHEVFERKLEQGTKHEDISHNLLTGNFKIGYDFGPVFTEADIVTRIDLKTNVFLCTGLNLVAGKVEFSPLVASDIHNWYYGARIYIKPVYLQAERYKDNITGHYNYVIVIGLKGSLFE